MAIRAITSEAEDSKRSEYPYATLQKALEIAAVVRDLGGSNDTVQKGSIAKHLMVPEAAPSLHQNISAAKSFNLIDGRGNYRLTECAKRYFFPTDDAEKHQAILEMIKCPSVFEALIIRFDGQKVPVADVLVNVLQRHFDVTASWRPRVAALFLSALRDAQIVDANGILRYKASLNGGGVVLAPMSATVASAPSTNSPVGSTLLRIPAPENSPASDMTTWVFRGIRLQTPEHMTMELWKKLSDYVNVLKPEVDSTRE
jgi:hypothetical protein